MVQPKISFEGGEEMVAFAKCTQEECAWWDEERVCCHIRTLSKQVNRLADRVNEIKDKMPHEEQFRK